MLQVDDGRIVEVREERTRLAALVPFWVEHEVVDDQLALSVEEIGQGLLAIRALEGVGLLDTLSRQLLTQLGQLVA